MLNIAPLKKPGRLRPWPHISDAIAIYTGQPEDVMTIFPTDNTEAKDDFLTALNALIDTRADLIGTNKAAAASDIADLVNATSLSSGEKADLITAIESAISTNISEDMTALKADASTALDAEFGDLVPMDLSKAGILADIRSELQDKVIADPALPYMDPKCRGEGRHPANKEPGQDPANTTPMNCTSCDGFGYTAIQNEARVANWSVLTTYPL